MGFDLSSHGDVPQADAERYAEWCAEWDRVGKADSRDEDEIDRLDAEAIYAGYFGRFNILGWTRLLNLAAENGWEPAGTVMEPNVVAVQMSKEVQDLTPQDLKWDGGYCSNALQTVTADDAQGIADALEKALDEAVERGFGRTHVEGFIKFCRRGAFTIS